MKVTFIEKKVNVSNRLKRYAEEKLAKLDRFFHTDAEARLAFSKEGGRQVAELTIFAESLVFRAKEQDEDMHAAIDAIIDTIVRQIRKNKTRLEKRLRAKTFEPDSPVYDTGEDVVEEEGDFAIVRQKRFSIKPMTPEEAILQMNLLGHSFFVFKNQLEEDAFAVVYCRADGGYGLIEED